MSQGPGRGAEDARLRPAELLSGLAVVFFVLALVLLAAWRSGAFERLTRERRTAVTWFHSIGSLKEQEQVVFKGYPMGEITQIAFDDQRRLIRVTMAIDADFVLPERAIALVTVASMSALSAYIEITSDFSNVDTTALVRGSLNVVDSGGIIELDAVDPMTTGTLLTQGSAFLARADAQMNNFFASTESQLAVVDRTLSDPAVRETLHGGAAEARVATADAVGAVSRADAAIRRGTAAARDAERWMADREDSIATKIRSADEAMPGARAWMAEFAANPAIAPQ